VDPLIGVVRVAPPKAAAGGLVRRAVGGGDPLLLLTGVHWFLLAGSRVGRWPRRHKETRA
jgi:hypothetical protein